MNRSFDVVVIGTGPGGEGAAMQLAKCGKRVAVVERYDLIGGGCTHWGTIPSKALRMSIYQLTEALRNPLLVRAGVHANVSVSELRRNSQSIINSQVALRQKFYERNDVEILHGEARFLDRERIVLNGEEIKAEYFVIATGSRPYRPAEVNFSHPLIFDSDTILGLDRQVHSITIYGAGVVGCEYASMFRNLDWKINLVNNRARLLDFLDDEISDALSYHMRERGVVIRHNEAFEKIEAADDSVVLRLKSGKEIKSDILLWAAGRTGNTDRLGLETVGLAADSRGYLAVDQHGQTQLSNNFAVGDVVGFPSLASAAYTQGREAGRFILGFREDGRHSDQIPSGIYTSPEISSIGKTERELTEEKVPYEVGIAHFKSIARAQIIEQTAGVLKILFHRKTLEILGVHCFGANATEIIHIGQAIMAQPTPGNTLRYFTDSTFNYPTMAEAYRVAALNGFNRLF
ncbi:MAG: Si-specific NAD(P)(+) transhydrogenase [Pirellulaceae bacterium]